MKRSPIKPGAKSLARRSTFASHGEGLKRKTSPARPRAISPASPEQRAKVKGRLCLICGEDRVHPAHVIDRSLGGDDDPRAVVPLCPFHHRDYDEGRLSLLEYLEPRHRDELAYAVQLVGLICALQRITNCRWCPEEAARAA